MDEPVAEPVSGPFYRPTSVDPVLSSLLADPVLSDVPKNATLKDVETLIALEKGSAMKLWIFKADSTCFEVTVVDTATVGDLRRAVEHVWNDRVGGSLGRRKISWRHVWGAHCLSTEDGKRLADDGSRLRDLGVRNSSSLYWKRHVAQAKSGTRVRRHARARRRRFRAL